MSNDRIGMTDIVGDGAEIRIGDSGSIDVEPEPGGGTAFFIRPPLQAPGEAERGEKSV